MTAQIRDKLFHNNNLYYLITEPLKSYLENTNLPHKLVATNSSCWKGYKAVWEVIDGKLYLVEWTGNILDFQEVGMDYLFPDCDEVFAEWFTGKIRVGVGKMLRYIHGGYLSPFEGDMYLVFEKGILVDEYTIWLTQEEIDIIMQHMKEDLEHFFDDVPF